MQDGFYGRSCMFFDGGFAALDGNESVLLKNKYYLYLTEFFSGMSVMAVELGASRLLAPYFSSSQIVWTIIIGTIMIAMALGNVYGGKSADKDPDPDRLYRRILIAAVWIAAIPVAGKYLIILISGLLVLAVDTNFLILAAFVSCMVIFVFPLFLLGTVTPSLVKYSVKSLDVSGETVGMLGAMNTIGSILGTFLPTFVTIPSVGTSVTFLIFSGILLALGLVYFLSRKSGKKAAAVSLVLFLICTVLGHSDSFAFWEKELAYEGESVYNYLQVRETEEDVILSTNVLFGVQSITKKNGGLTGMYYDYAMAAPLMAGFDPSSGEPCRVLILGMGTGTYARQCLRYFGNMEIEGVEIDEKITALAGTYFDCPPEAVTVTYDGRAYLAAADRQYDVIMVDAYQDITIPFQMSSAEFFEMVRAHLVPGGVMVVNMNMRSGSEGSINEYLADTICSVFPCAAAVDVAGGTNRELFASDSPAMEENLREGIARLADRDLAALLTYAADSLSACGGGEHILTDDRAPVELLGMRAIDEIIRDEMVYYKDIFRKEGIGGLIAAF